MIKQIALFESLRLFVVLSGRFELIDSAMYGKPLIFGPLWHVLNILWYANDMLWFWWLFLGSIAVGYVVYVWEGYQIWLTYAMTEFVFGIGYVHNVVILWLLVFGLKFWICPILGALVKFPYGFDQGREIIFNVQHLMPYLLLAGWFFGIYAYRWSKTGGLINRPKLKNRFP